MVRHRLSLLLLLLWTSLFLVLVLSYGGIVRGVDKDGLPIDER